APTNGWSLLQQLDHTIYAHTASSPKLRTSGRTSDRRLFANQQTQDIECGVINSTIHLVNEHVPGDDLL
ncbi:succinyl-diaminopimelate desuccinylase, partial [Pseudoalteromonas sp. S2893]